MSIIRSNSRNAIKSLERRVVPSHNNKMYLGMNSQFPKLVKPLKAQDSLAEKMSWLKSGLHKPVTPSIVTKSGNGGRQFSNGVLPSVRATNAKDYI